MKRDPPPDESSPIVARALQRGYVVGERINTRSNDLSIDDEPRSRVAAACFSVAHDHQLAILLLIEEQLYSSALALLRPVFESYVRGVWLSECATDAEVERFARDDKIPELNVLIKTVQRLEHYSEGRLSAAKLGSWKTLCSFTHTGALQVERWNTADAIEPNYSDDEIARAADFAGAYAILSAIGMCRLGRNEALANELLVLIKEFVASDGRTRAD